MSDTSLLLVSPHGAGGTIGFHGGDGTQGDTTPSKNTHKDGCRVSNLSE